MSEKIEKKCFIITPIGDKNSEVYRHIEGVIGTVIRPLLEENHFTDIKAAHEIDISGSINNQIINRILNDDLVIANLTGNNPNVMYELAIRHATAKPIIHICDENTNLPFDIKGERTIFYKNDIKGADELKIKIKSFLEKLDYEKEYFDNPIYNAQQSHTIMQKMEDSEPMKFIVDSMTKMHDEISTIKNQLNEKNTIIPEYNNLISSAIKIDPYSVQYDPAYSLFNVESQSLLTKPFHPVLDFGKTPDQVK
jgi:hypothetical protein